VLLDSLLSLIQVFTAGRRKGAPSYDHWKKQAQFTMDDVRKGTRATLSRAIHPPTPMKAFLFPFRKVKKTQDRAEVGRPVSPQSLWQGETVWGKAPQARAISAP
jgi:hypothetical protein